MGCKCFPPVCSLSLNSLDSVFGTVSLIYWFFFSLTDCAFGIISSNPRSQKRVPMLSSTSFTLLCFTLASMTHFKLIFGSGVRFSTKVQFYIQMANCNKTAYWKDHSSLNELILYLRQRSNGSINVVYFRTHYPAPLIFQQSHVVLITKAWYEKVIPPTLFFLFKFVLAIPWPLHINHSISWYEKSCWDFDWLQWICVSLRRKIGSLLCWLFNPQIAYVSPFIYVFLDFFWQCFVAERI